MGKFILYGNDMADNKRDTLKTADIPAEISDAKSVKTDAEIPAKKMKKKISDANIWAWVFIGAIFSFILIIYAFARFSVDLPEYDKLAEYQPSVISRFYAGDGTLLTEYADENRIFVEYDQLPANLINAFLAAEDKKFWRHSGIDLVGICRAILMNTKSMFTGGSFQGASTITQQVAKNFFLTSERSISRKIKEAILALKIERAFTKKHIIVLYFNQIYLGARSFGVAAAAQAYFNKSLNELTLAESAFLAALPKAPNNYNPVTKKARAIDRRNWVLGRMLAEGYISQEEYDDAKADDLVVSSALINVSENANLYFTEEVRRALMDEYGEKQLYRGGLAVRTTADSNFQKYATRAVRNTILEYDRKTGWKGAEVNYNFENLNWIDEKIDALRQAKKEMLSEETADSEPVVYTETEDLKSIQNTPLGRLLTLKEKLAANDAKPADKKSPVWFVILTHDDLLSGMEKNGWRKAIVLSVEDARATIGLKDNAMGTIPLSGAAWARPTDKMTMTVGPVPNSMKKVLNVGDIIFVAPTNDNGVFDLKQTPKLEAALVAMDPNTGRILATVGGFSYDRSKFNRATQARRQPGSSIKPFIYLAGLERGYEPNSILLDAPIVMEKEDGNLWKPDNSDNMFMGDMTFRRALERSRNGPAVRLANAIGIRNAIRMAEKFGVYRNVRSSDINLSMAIGSGDTTLLEMTAAFAALLNGGKKITPRFVDRVQDRNGKTIFNFDNRACENCLVDEADLTEEILMSPPKIEDKREQLASQQSIYQMISIMEGVVKEGTGTMARIPGRTIAGKTGTTNDNKDGWFVGGTTDLVVGVWFGFDRPANMGEYHNGATLSAPTFEAFAKNALRGFADKSFPIPEGIKFVRINKMTGKLATSDDEPKNIILEALKVGAKEDVGNAENAQNSNSNSLGKTENNNQNSGGGGTENNRFNNSGGRDMPVDPEGIY